MLRCALLKQYRQLSYQELAFHLSDSASFRAFARLPLHWCPKKSVLQETISAISARTWERINRCLLASASETKVETGTLLRLDSTVTATLLHPLVAWRRPTPSSQRHAAARHCHVNAVASARPVL